MIHNVIFGYCSNGDKGRGRKGENICANIRYSDYHTQTMNVADDKQMLISTYSIVFCTLFYAKLLLGTPCLL